MERKFRIDFNEGNVLESVNYTLVAEYNLRPNVLRADIAGDGSGFMLLSIVGAEGNIREGIDRIKTMGFTVRELSGHITQDTDRCWSCGACMSVCPTKSLYHNDALEVRLNTSTCIACEACINACSVKAIRIEL